MNRRTADLIGLVMAAVVVAFVADEWSSGGLTRYVKTRLAVPVGVPLGRDYVPPAAIAGVVEEARRITKEAAP